MPAAAEEGERCPFAPLVAAGIGAFEGREGIGGAFVRAVFFCCRAKVLGLRDRDRARFSKEESEEGDSEEGDSVSSTVASVLLMV